MTSREQLTELGLRPEDLASQNAALKIDFLSLPDLAALPPTFPAGEDVESWARESAQAWWENSGLKHRRGDVTLLRETLAGTRQIIYAADSPLLFHTAVLHLPGRIASLPIMLGVWPSVGDRDTQLNTLTGIGHPGLAKPAIAEEFSTDRLGSGLKTLVYTRAGNGTGVNVAINYAWRSEELGTALRIFAAGIPAGCRRPSRILTNWRRRPNSSPGDGRVVRG